MPQADAAAFRLTPDLRFLFAHEACEAAFAAICEGIRRGDPLLLVTGPYGVGKTLLLRRIESHLAREGVPAAYAAYPKLDLEQLLAWSRAGAPVQLPARSCVVMLDDADRCSDDLLSELHGRVASGRAEIGVQLVLAGGPNFAGRLAAEFPQLMTHVRVHAQLGPLDSVEARAYIRHRLDVLGGSEIELASEAARDVFRYSQGIPRLINHACARALLLAGQQRPIVSQEIAREAIEDYVANISFGQTNTAQFAPPEPTDEADAIARISATAQPAAEAQPAEQTIEMRDQLLLHPSRESEASEHAPAVPPEGPASPSTATEPAAWAAPFEVELGIPAPPSPPAPRPRAEVPAGSRSRRPNQKLRALARRSDAAADAAPPGHLPKFSGFRPRRAPAVVAGQRLRLHAPDRAARSASKLWLRLSIVALIGTGLAATIVKGRPHLPDGASMADLRIAAGAAFAKAEDAIRDAVIIVRRKVDDLI